MATDFYSARAPRGVIGTIHTRQFLAKFCNEAGKIKTPPLRITLTISAILLLATFLRLYQLDQIPPGLHYDEAFNAIQARDILRGISRPIFITENFGEEPMQMYVEAFVFALAGQSPFAARLSNVVLGILLIPALYFCARTFFPKDKFTALIAAFIGATLYWAINFSRLGLETNSLPWILTLSAGVLLLANEKRDWRVSALAGILLGGTIYTYLASRVWPIAVALWFVYLIIFHRTRLHLKNWLITTLCTALVIAPFALFFINNPLALTGRAGQVLTPDQLGINLVRTAGMFFISGDTDPRDNLPGRPALDPFLALLFIIGLGITIVRTKKPPYAFLLIWFVAMTLPSALTEFAPNFRRAIGALPAVVLLCAVGANWLRLSLIARRQSFVNGLLILGFAYSAWSSANAYFVEWARGTGLYYSFDTGLLQLAQKLAARPANEEIYLSPNYYDHPTVLWAMDGRTFSAFDGRRVSVLKNSDATATYGIITYEDRQSALSRFFPSASPPEILRDAAGEPYAQIFQTQGAVHIQPQFALDARVGNTIHVLGYDLVRESTRIDLNIYWRADGTLREDYTSFVHLLGPNNPATNSPVWAQDDAQPGHGTYPTSRWQAGQTIIDKYTLIFPAQAPAATYQIEMGMYLLVTGTRVPVFVNRTRATEDRLLFGEIKR